MSGNPEYQSLDPSGVPGSITPPDSPYDIQAGNDEAAITAAADAAGAVSGAGIVYPQGARQRATEELLNSGPGFSAGTGLTGYDIPQGWSGEPDESWMNNTQASSVLETPIQGMGDYPGTMQDGLQKYGTS